jgi:stearoyl-CoA desaturase (Delta-9 desaturase)
VTEETDVLVEPLAATEIRRLDARTETAATTLEARPVRPFLLHLQRSVTALVLFGPLAGVVLGVLALARGHISGLDIALAVFFYALTGHGITAGFHRMFAHRAFKARRLVKISLAVAGSLAIEGSLNAWVANHRRHHVYSDRDGDPHSPYAYGTSPWACVRGALHAHVGWMFQAQETDVRRWAPDLEADHDLVVVSRLFPLLCVATLALPTLIAWAVTGTASGAIGGFVWGGLVRVFVLQHSTFAVNSACHIWGKRPFTTHDDDRATNFAPMALLTMGENWHNLHHSSPSLARHGVDRGQLDSTARLIWLLERARLVRDVRWPDRTRLDLRRRPAAAPPPVR